LESSFNGFAEIQAARADYSSGDYTTFDEYNKQRANQGA